MDTRGVPELWLVDGEARTVLAFRRAASGSAAFDVALELAAPATLTSPLLPGLGLPLAELFAPHRR